MESESSSLGGRDLSAVGKKGEKNSYFHCSALMSFRLFHSLLSLMFQPCGKRRPSISLACGSSTFAGRQRRDVDLRDKETKTLHG